MNERERELRADIAIIGGSLGGVAAAIAAARNGLRVILTEETDWIGGQLTSQGVPPDENPYIEQFGCTRSYREFRNRVRDYYRRNFPLTAEARSRWNLNPGDGWVSRLCHEPRVALAVLEEMLLPYLSSGQVTLLLHHKPVDAETNGDQVTSVTVYSLRTGNETVLTAPYFLDATELGDLLPLSGTEYVTGAEGQSDTQEMHAAPTPQPENMQAFTVCFAIDYREGEDHTITKPEEYDFWRDYVPPLTPAWPGKLLSLTDTSPFTMEERTHPFAPTSRYAEAQGLWFYRRIRNGRNFTDGGGDICLINWPMNDYLPGNLIGVSAEEAENHIRRAKGLSLSLLYWLQTEAPRPDGGTGWKGLRLRRDVLGTEDGLAKAPYIREARRIQAEFTIREQHVGTDARMELTGLPKESVQAASFPDSVGIGQYRIDLHPSTGGDNYIDVSCLPFQIPLGALLPVRMENLLPACKNLGVTHITNGCYRLHPVEWNIGEATGMLVAYCKAMGLLPRQVRNNADHLAEFQKFVIAQGIEIAWPHVRPV